MEELIFQLELKMDQANDRLDSLVKKSDDVGKTSGSSFGSAFASALGAILSKISFDKMMDFNKQLIGIARTVEDQMADVRKTTGLTTDQLSELEQELFKMGRTTRTSNEDLRAMAEETGRLGITGKDNILQFVDAVNMLAVALGDSFAGAGEVVEVLGKFNNNVKDIPEQDKAKRMLLLGNALNVMDQATAATASSVADMSNRIQGLAPELGTGNILAYAAVLDELNVRAERGGSAVGRLTNITGQLVSDSKDVIAVAKAMGLSVEETRKLFNSDTNEFIIQFTQAIAGGEYETTQLITTLDALGLDGVYVMEVLKKLGRNTDLLRDRQRLANEALTNTNSIMDEYSIKNATSAAEQKKFANRMEELKVAAGKSLIPALTKAIEIISPLLDKFTEFTNNHPQIVAAFLLIGTALAGVASVALGLASAVQFLTGIFGGGAAGAAGGAAAGGGLAASLLALSGPIAVIVAGILVLVGMFTLMWQNSETLRDRVSSSFDFLTNAASRLRENFWLNIGRIIGFFATLPLKLGYWIYEASKEITSKIVNYDWAGAWGSIWDYFVSGQALIDFYKVWKSVSDGILKAVGDLFSGLWEGARQGTPAENKPPFKSGGYTGSGNPNQVAGIVHKNEVVMNPRQMAGLIMAMSKIGNQITNNTNNYGVPFGNAFINPAFV